MRSAKLERSERLQRVAKYLSDGLQHSTRDIVMHCNVMAAGTAVSELRDNGLKISCKRKGDIWLYQMEV